MSNPLWIGYKERTHGVNSNGYTDISNRPNRTIWSNFCTEHNKDGTHKEDLLDAPALNTVWEMEVYTYQGNGADDRTITLQDTSIDVRFVRIFSADYAYTWFAFDTIHADYAGYSLSTQGYSAGNRIQAMGVGNFQIGSADEVNHNGTTFFYIVYGVQT